MASAQSLLIAIALTATGVVATASDANARPSTKAFTCDGVRAYIAKRGAVVMNTKNAHVYDRLVRDVRYCPAPLFLRTRTVPTKSGSCRVRHCDQTPPLLGPRLRGFYN